MDIRILFCEGPQVEKHRMVSQIISDNMDQLVEELISCQWEIDTEIADRYSEPLIEKCKEDIAYHLEFLATAVRVQSTAIFNSYLRWTKVLFSNLGVPEKEFLDNLECIKKILPAYLSDEIQNIPIEYIDIGIKELALASSDLPTLMGEDIPMAAIATQYLDALLKGNRRAASALIMDTVNEGREIKEIYLNIFERTQYEIGRLWQTNQINVAQEHYCTAATQLIMAQLYPYLFSSKKKNLNMVATCISGELHEIGIRMVADLFEIDGWNTFYLGASTPRKDIIQTIIDRDVQLVAISATLPTNIPEVQELIEEIRAQDNLTHVKIIVGGRPFGMDPNLWKTVGADGTARNAEDAVKVGNMLVQGD
ncbi:MAG: cobalamin-binding protein [Candidatus Lokiarchaeota archaeon]|nr:cobalamin-binding protein [Candidatus Lokiarchaeota archaeon]